MNVETRGKVVQILMPWRQHEIDAYLAKMTKLSISAFPIMKKSQNHTPAVMLSVFILKMIIIQLWLTTQSEDCASSGTNKSPSSPFKSVFACPWFCFALDSYMSTLLYHNQAVNICEI